MPHLLTVALTFVIALVDSTLKGTPAYTPLNIGLRLLILLPLAFGVTVGASPYAGRLRRTFGLVAVADALLPVVFPAGMAAFLVVHLLNAHNFWQEVELRRGRWASVALPAAGALGLALVLYVRFLYPTMDAFFRVVVAVYLVPIAAALGLAVTGWVQTRARGAALAAAGMFLFFWTDFQVAVQFLTDTRIPAYGLVNALIYYGGLGLMAEASRWARPPARG